jgi:hypothetical protein
MDTHTHIQYGSLSFYSRLHPFLFHPTLSSSPISPPRNTFHPNLSSTLLHYTTYTLANSSSHSTTTTLVLLLHVYMHIHTYIYTLHYHTYIHLPYHHHHHHHLACFLFLSFTCPETGWLMLQTDISSIRMDESIWLLLESSPTTAIA